MVQLRAQSEANFATVEVDVEDENDNPPSFSSVSILVSLMQSCILMLRYLLRFARFSTYISSVILQGFISFLQAPFFVMCLSISRFSLKYAQKLLFNKWSFLKNTVISQFMIQDFFPQNSFIASVYENQNPNTTVSKIVAKDSDEGINSEISYYLNGSLSLSLIIFIISILLPFVTLLISFPCHL